MLTTDHNNKYTELITDYLSGNISDSELKQLNDWIHESPKNKTEFFQMYEIWFSAAGARKLKSFDKETAYRKFKIRKSLTSDKRKNITFFAKYIKQTAAAAIIVTLIGSASYWLVHQDIVGMIAKTTIETPIGLSKKIYLPDSTAVWLKPSSKISYSKIFGTFNRQVVLEGEAFFDVKKKKNIAFRVETDKLTVKVLGTKFNVRNYNEDETINVALLEGSVKLSILNSNNEDIVLTPSHVAKYTKLSNVVKVFPANVKLISQWRDGILYFDDEKLSNICLDLERIYNVNISISNDSLSNSRFFGSFNCKNQNINEVLDIIAATNRIKYKQHSRDIMIVN